ncbi:Exc2 family lipoprotein [Citrobacter sp. BDA59-3]|nr:Exc2 family lipoprotein [Citrobacter sp. BDA59-3]
MMKKITLMIMAVALAACSTQTSPERHARHFAYNASETMNGNMVTDRGAWLLSTYRSFRIFMPGVWQTGKKG